MAELPIICPRCRCRNWDPIAAQAHARWCAAAAPSTTLAQGEVLLVEPPPTSRRELLREAVIEAARHYMAAHLVAERQENAPPRFEATEDAVMQRDDALQTLRDALAAERRITPRRTT